MIDAIRSHFDRILATGQIDDMWWSSLDTRTGRYPVDDTRQIPKRVYRNIDAPGGVSLYWDMPHLRAACMLSDRIGENQYREAAHAYIRAYLERSIAATGLILWGNHYYYHVDHGSIVMFHSEEPPQPIDPTTHDGHLHEMRPLTPEWALLWEVDPAITERAIRAAGELHLHNSETGGFNRHADQKQNYDFLEAGGILVESLAWLYQKTNDANLLRTAKSIAQYSFAGRHPQTGLLRNSRDSKRWDHDTATTEVGIWTVSLLKAHKYAGDQSFVKMAAEAISAYLHYGLLDNGRLYGRLNVDDGQPQHEPKSTPYQPDVYSDPWNALFPSHDYPLHLASACLDLFELTGSAHFADAARAIASTLKIEYSERIRYAEHFGLHIAFLMKAASVLSESAHIEQADQFTQWTLDALYTDGMFRGHTGEDRYDAVDGVGILLQALLART